MRFEPRAAEAIVGVGPASARRAGRGGRARGSDGGGGRGPDWRSARSTARPRSGSRCRSTSSGRWSTRRASPDGLRDRGLPGDRRRRGAAQQRRRPRRAADRRRAARSRARRAVADADGTWRLTGEKTWTTWLPNLTHAFVTARIDGTPSRSRSARGWWTSSADGVERRPGFEALGMRGRPPAGSCSTTSVPADARPHAARWSAQPDPRGPAPGAWFGIADRRDLPRGRGGRPDRRRALGARPTPGRRLDARRRHPERPAPARSPRRGAARGADRRPDVARRWDEAAAGRCGRLAAAAGDVPLAKLVATRAAVVRDRRGAPDRRRPGVPGRSARAGVPRRARRADQPAARGRRPDRVRGGAAGTRARLVERLTAHSRRRGARPTPAVGAGSRSSWSRCTGRARGRTCRGRRSPDCL